MDDLVKRVRARIRIGADDMYATQADEDLDEVLATIERLSAEKADFHMAYRIKCDEETKRLEARIAALEAERTETIEVIRSVNSKCAALEAENKALLSGQPTEVNGEKWQLVPVSPSIAMIGAWAELALARLMNPDANKGMTAATTNTTTNTTNTTNSNNRNCTGGSGAQGGTATGTTGATNAGSGAAGGGASC